MSKCIISEGKTVSEAIEKGIKIIGLPKELVDIKILDENKKSFFDILAPKIVKVELKEREAKKPEEFEIETTAEELENAKNKIDKFLIEFIQKLNNGATYNTKIKDKCLYVTINGEKVGNLIGYRGETLYALENILKSVVNQHSENNVIVRLDIEKYKEKRIKTLQELAVKKAKLVEKSGKIITLEPMKPYERKIIHSFLQENPNVETRSIGQDPKRRIVISKKQ